MRFSLCFGNFPTSLTRSNSSLLELPPQAVGHFSGIKIDIVVGLSVTRPKPGTARRDLSIEHVLVFVAASDDQRLRTSLFNRMGIHTIKRLQFDKPIQYRSSDPLYDGLSNSSLRQYPSHTTHVRNAFGMFLVRFALQIIKSDIFNSQLFTSRNSSALIICHMPRSQLGTISKPAGHHLYIAPLKTQPHW